MKIITFSLFRPPATLQLSICCESFFSLLLCYESIILISIENIARTVKASIVKTVKLQAALQKRNFILSGNFQSKCSFKMFREEHYHMTLSNKTPPPRFSRKHDMFRFFFRTRNLYFFS